MTREIVTSENRDEYLANKLNLPIEKIVVTNTSNQTANTRALVVKNVTRL